jgi:tetratricopeptide (TPR) repeat protein
MAMKYIMKICLATTIIFIMFSIPMLHAQDAKFRGTVKDEQDNPISNAKITLTLIKQNLSFSFETNKKGKFYRRGIEPGEYLLTVEVEGYQPLKQQIYIPVGEEMKMDIIVAKEASIVEAKDKFVLGVQFYQQGKFDEAIEAFNDVLKEKPDFAEGYYNLGMAYLRKGDVDLAQEKMEKTIELKPDFIEGYFGLGQVYIEKKEEQKAAEIFQKAIDIKPDDAKIFVNLGALYFSLNKDDLALDNLLKAKELDPQLPNTYYQLGLLYFSKEELKRAVENFEKFVELAPQAAEAETVKSIIEELKKKIKEQE